MKQQLVKITRKMLPSGVVKKLEQKYRQNRIKILEKEYHNPAKKVKTLAITGTNGKTSSLCMLNSIIKASGKTTILLTTAGTEIAGEWTESKACQTVLGAEKLQQIYQTAVDQEIDYVLLEVTSHALSQHKIPDMNLIACGITNLSQDHLDYHKTMESYAKEKLKLFTDFGAQNIILNSDDQWFDFFSKNINQFYTYGTSNEAYFEIIKAKLFKQGTDITIKHNDEIIELGTPMPGKFNAYNATLTVAIAKTIGIDNQSIIDGLAQFEGVKGRFNYIKNDLGIDIIVDYAHTPDGLEKILEFAKTVCKGKVSVVFGSAGDRDEEKRPIMGQIAAKIADRVFVTDDDTHGENPAQIRQQIIDGIDAKTREKKVIEIADRADAIEAAIEVSEKGDMVIVAGLGHQAERIIGETETISWNDAEQISKILTKK